MLNVLCLLHSSFENGNLHLCVAAWLMHESVRIRLVMCTPTILITQSTVTIDQFIVKVWLSIKRNRNRSHRMKKKAIWHHGQKWVVFVVVFFFKPTQLHMYAKQSANGPFFERIPRKRVKIKCSQPFQKQHTPKTNTRTQFEFGCLFVVIVFLFYYFFCCHLWWRASNGVCHRFVQQIFFCFGDCCTVFRWFV